MRVVNNAKDRARTILRNDIDSNTTCINRLITQSNNLRTMISNIMEGAANSKASVFSEDLIQELRGAIEELNRCRQYIDQIDVTEEVRDDNRSGYYW